MDNVTRTTTFDIIHFEDDEGVAEDLSLSTLNSNVTILEGGSALAQDLTPPDLPLHHYEEFNKTSYPPFTFWDDLRTKLSLDAEAKFQTLEDSSIIRIPAQLTTPDASLTEVRLAHIASMLAISGPYGLDSVFHNALAAGVLALKHLNERKSSLMGDLPERMQACPDLFFTMDLYDSRFSVMHAARQFSLEIANLNEHSLATPRPMALAGATRSAVSKTLATIAGVQNVPIISHVSA